MKEPEEVEERADKFELKETKLWSSAMQSAIVFGNFANIKHGWEDSAT